MLLSPEMFASEKYSLYYNNIPYYTDCFSQVSLRSVGTRFLFFIFRFDGNLNLDHVAFCYIIQLSPIGSSVELVQIGNVIMEIALTFPLTFRPGTLTLL